MISCNYRMLSGSLDEKGWTKLMQSVFDRDYDNVEKLLIDHKADPNFGFTVYRKNHLRFYLSSEEFAHAALFLAWFIGKKRSIDYKIIRLLRYHGARFKEGEMGDVTKLTRRLIALENWNSVARFIRIKIMLKKKLFQARHNLLKPGGKLYHNAMNHFHSCIV